MGDLACTKCEFRVAGGVQGEAMLRNHVLTKHQPKRTAPEPVEPPEKEPTKVEEPKDE